MECAAAGEEDHSERQEGGDEQGDERPLHGPDTALGGRYGGFTAPWVCPCPSWWSWLCSSLWPRVMGAILPPTTTTSNIFYLAFAEF